MAFIKQVLYEIVRFPIIALWRLSGWRVTQPSVPEDKVVMTGAPHTSNIDYLFFLLTALHLRRKIYVTVKKELFFFPVGNVIAALGGIPIDRENSYNLVGKLAERLKEADRMILLFTPDGSRSYRPHWKSGFYWTAYEAGVPIRLGIASYRKRIVNVDHQIIPSGDIEADFEIIRQLQTQYGAGLFDSRSNPVITRAAYKAQQKQAEDTLSAQEATPAQHTQVQK